MVLIGTTWGWGGADGGPKIASLCPIGGNIGRFWEVNAVERGIKIVSMGIVCFVLSYEGNPCLGTGKGERMITGLGNIEEFTYRGPWSRERGYI